MVEFKERSSDNVVDFASRMETSLSRRVAHHGSGLPPDTFLAHVRKNDSRVIDFRLPSFDGENRRNLQILGISFAMAIALTATASALAFLGSRFFSLFA